VKKSLNYSLKQSLLAAIAVSCVAIVSACQQPPAPTETAATTKSTAAATTKASPTTAASASPTTKTPDSAPDKTPTSTASLEKVAGEYTVVLDPKVLADAEKEGVKSVTGKWTIKPEGTFEATLKAVSTKDEVQEIKTAGKIAIKDGKVVSQVESVNGEKPPQAPPEQPYTLSADGKELQADGQPVKLVKQ
jgi:ABC-type transport system substrate-binding protein